MGLAPFKKGLLNIIFIIFMNTKIKTYKIIVDSKPFANIRGSTPAEVAKKAASKILGNSLNRTRFSIQKKVKFYITMQNGKIWFALIIKMGS